LEGKLIMDDMHLTKLLESYRFIDGAIEQHGASMSSGDVERLREEREATFQSLLLQNSTNPDVTIAQLRLLIGMIGTMPDNASAIARSVVSICLGKLDSLVSKPNKPVSAATPATALSEGLHAQLQDPTQLNLLDSLTYRIALIDLEYRYVFSNQANKRFHKQPLSWFVGRPLWDTTNTKFFETINKPTFDKCFAGHSMAYTSAHPGRDLSILYSTQVDPIRDAKGKVIGGIAIARTIRQAQLSDSTNA
jgi:hypothetical protein